MLDMQLNLFKEDFFFFPNDSQNQITTLTIITGIGNHSENNVAKIKPAIESLLVEKGYTFEQDSTGGALLVQIVPPSQASFASSFFSGLHDLFSSIMSFCFGR